MNTKNNFWKSKVYLSFFISCFILSGCGQGWIIKDKVRTCSTVDSSYGVERKMYHKYDYACIQGSTNRIMPNSRVAIPIEVIEAGLVEFKILEANSQDFREIAKAIQEAIGKYGYATVYLANSTSTYDFRYEVKQNHCMILGTR